MTRNHSFLICICYISIRKIVCLFEMNLDKKEWIIFGCGVLTLLAGILLAFVGIYIPPTGIIDGTVLTVIAEFLTFSGSAMGIGSYTAIKMHQIDKKIKDELDK